MRTHRILAPLAACSFALVAFSGTAVAATPNPEPLPPKGYISAQECREAGGVPKYETYTWYGLDTYVCIGGAYDEYLVLD
ncbi:hypothetical protein AB0N14_35660 [Streptomyces sp. NPDC051104]|uniref:hypothetical protein n=1 Tax=Streptomyces sp. NPDC051104 TaxID=3155044 RepID=UPI00344327C4